MATKKRPRWPLSADHAFGPPVVSPRYRSGTTEADRAAIGHIQRSLGVEETGYYTPATAQAVKDWQSEKGLLADGLVTRKLWSRIVKPV